MTVKDLNRDQLNELKEAYFDQLMDYDCDTIGNISCAEEIPDAAVLYHYDGIIFNDNDFFCSCKK